MVASRNTLFIQTSWKPPFPTTALVRMTENLVSRLPTDNHLPDLMFGYPTRIYYAIEKAGIERRHPVASVSVMPCTQSMMNQEV